MSYLLPATSSVTRAIQTVRAVIKLCYPATYHRNSRAVIMGRIAVEHLLNGLTINFDRTQS